MDKLEIRVLVESMYGDESPTPGSSAAESRASMLGLAAQTKGDQNPIDQQLNKGALDQLVKGKYDMNMTDLNSIQDTATKGILRNKYSRSMRNDGDLITETMKGPLFEKGTWFQEHNIPKVAKGLAVAAARETVDVAVSIQKYQSSNASKNHELDKNMKLVNYGASIGIAAAINPVAGAAVAAGIVISEIGSYIKQSSEYKYDQRLAGQNRETVRAAAGNLSYGRPRGD